MRPACGEVKPRYRREPERVSRRLGSHRHEPGARAGARISPLRHRHPGELLVLRPGGDVLAWSGTRRRSNPGRSRPIFRL